jgi:tetratricopeptide (TPR) repeat protein
MPGKSSILGQFWRELKRRKVVSVITVYAATAFIIIEAGDIILPRLGLPEWILTLIIILLIIGLPITAILSWIFDITPEGLRKTEPVEAAVQQEDSPELTRRKLRLSDVVIAILLVFVVILVYPKIFGDGSPQFTKDKDGRISIAVMPFKNITGDSIYNPWQEGLQNLLITSLSNSEELAVRQYETIYGILGSGADITYASLTPTLAGQVAQKLEANTVIVGNMHKFGNNVRITANIIDVSTEEIYKSYEIDGTTEDDFLSLIDSLSIHIKNFLEIKSLKRTSFFDIRNVYTNSTEAYKLYIQGHNCHFRLDYGCALEFYNKALEIDSNFVSAMMKLSYCYGDIGQARMSKYWAYKAFNRIDQLPHDMQLMVKEVKAAVDKEPLEQIKQMKQYMEIHPDDMIKQYTIGWVYFNTKQWPEAIEAFEQTLELSRLYGLKTWAWTYLLLGRAYHYSGKHKEEQIIFNDGREQWPGEKSNFDFLQAVCAVSQGDSINAQFYMDEIRKMCEQKGWPRANLLLWYADLYSEAKSLKKAETNFREAISIYPDDALLMNNMAYFLISNDIDIEEGMALINTALAKDPENGTYLYTYGLGLYKTGKLENSLEVLRRSWELKPFYDHDHYILIKRIEESLVNL